MELVSGNIFIRPLELAQAGDMIDGHAHNFDHTTYIVKGSMLIEHLADDKITVLRAVTKKATDGQNWVLIRAGAYHRITALENETLGHCIYSHRNPQGDIVEKYEGWVEAYV